MFLHRMKMNWKKHQTLPVAILLIALARIVLENVFGEAPLSGYAILRIGLGVAAAMVAWASSRPAGNWGPYSIRGSALSQVHCADSAATFGAKRRQRKRRRSLDRLPGYFTIRTRLS